MTLNKLICQSCYNKHKKQKRYSIEWSQDQENRWQFGYVICPSNIRKNSLHITCIYGGPDIDHFRCPYEMEHLVLENDNA